MNSPESLVAPMKGTACRTIAGVQLDIAQAGAGRVKRVIYPPGFHWAQDMKPIVGTELCEHAHVGFLAQGQIHIRYADGCTLELAAPEAFTIDPGHDGWVVGEQPAVVVEFDFEGQTAQKFGIPGQHSH